MVPKLGGLENFEEGMLLLAAMTPMGAGLHEPVVICLPLVIGRLVVAQKLMKLLLEVKEATWPAVAFAWPSCSNPVAMTEESRATETESTSQCHVYRP